MRATSTCTSPTVKPWASALWRICSYSSEESRSALEGMHPTRRQVPPSAPSFTTHATLIPSCAARIAATYPPGPAPNTTRSKLLCSAMAINPLFVRYGNPSRQCESTKVRKCESSNFRTVALSYSRTRLSFQQHRLRVLNHLLHCDQEAHRLASVDDPVVVGEREVHDRTDLDL